MTELTADALFAGFPEGLAICRAVDGVVSGIGEYTVTVTKGQVAFRRSRPFAYVWRPGQYVRNDVPAVLSIASPTRIESPRFKEVVQPSPDRWMHHLELSDPHQIDDEVREWLAAAHDSAG